MLDGSHADEATGAPRPEQRHRRIQRASSVEGVHVLGRYSARANAR